MGVRRVVVVWSVLYTAVCLSWVGPWMLVITSLEWFGWCLLISLHACLAVFVVSLHAVTTAGPTHDRVVMYSTVLEQNVGVNVGRSFGRFLLSGLVATWTISVGAILRLCELGGFIHVGPVLLGSEASYIILGLLIFSELIAAAVMPVFAVALWQYLHAGTSSSRLENLVRLL
jgi:hypothetical protein